MPGLSLRNIAKYYGKEKILENLDLDVEDGEFVVLVGPSGSGKSTIIRIIAGLEDHSSGEIHLANEEIGSKAPKDRDLSMVFQNYALYPHKSVYENIAFPLQMNKETGEFIDSKVNNVAKNLEINHLLDRKPRQLSGGQRQRVAVARAMVKEPKLFLMDEPLSNLDAKLRGQMRQEIAHLHRETKSMFIYVTHDQVEALSLGDKIVVLDQGQIQQIGSPQEIYDNPANSFVASFIGSPPTNLIEEKDRIVGVRPEFFNLEKGPKDDQELEVYLHNIELLGNEFLIYAYLDEGNTYSQNNKRVIIKTSSDIKSNHIYQNFKEKELIKLYYSSNKVYYFDKITGVRI